MGLRLKHLSRDALRRGARFYLIIALAWVALAVPIAWAADAATPPAEAPPAVAEVPAEPSEMTTGPAGWLEHIIMGLEHEAISDVSMLPDTPSALEREWRSLDRNGSALGALIGLGWVALATCLALLAERLTARGVSWRLRRALRTRIAGPSVGDLLLLLLCDALGLAVFGVVFVYSRHWLMNVGVSLSLILLAANVLIRWRIFVLIPRMVLERLTERGWHDSEAPHGRAAGVHRLVALSFHRILRAIVLLIAILTLASFWIDALDLTAMSAAQAMHTVTAAVGTLFVAYLVWELARLAIDRNLQNMPGGPKLPGTVDD